MDTTMNQEKKKDDDSSKAKEILEQIKHKFKVKNYREIDLTEMNELLEENTLEANRIKQILRFIELGSKFHAEKMEFKAF